MKHFVQIRKRIVHGNIQPLISEYIANCTIHPCCLSYWFLTLPVSRLILKLSTLRNIQPIETVSYYLKGHNSILINRVFKRLI